MQRFVDLTPVSGLLVIVVNAVVFGAVACGLRKYSLTLISALPAISYFSLPPSDANLERQFSEKKREFEVLMQKVSKTPSVVRISNVEIADSDGKKYIQDDSQAPFSSESRTEYREIFQKTGMVEGLYRSRPTGQLQFLGHTMFGKLVPIGTLYGYIYCSGIGDYRHKRIASERFIVEFFVMRSTTNCESPVG